MTSLTKREEKATLLLKALLGIKSSWTGQTTANLIDLGSSRLRMTWTNNRQGLANTMERLDRAMSNSEWRTMFPEATVRVLPRTYSDHSPFVVYT